MSRSIAVIVSANPDWAYADIGASVALLVASAGSSAPSGLKAVKDARTVWQLYQATRYMRGVASVAGNIWKAFAEKGTVIEPGAVVDLQQRSQSNPLEYLNPSQYGALAGAKDLQLMIQIKDGPSACFNSNSDDSWIALPAGYARAQYGKLWVPCDGPHAWT
jgi:hypothetical protein